MRFLADESVDRQIVDRLRQDGHLVLSVAEMEPGIPDDSVLSRAREEGSILVTADKDFGELVFRLGRVTSGVVLLRLAGLAPDEKPSLVASVISEHLAQLAQGFAVITPRVVRVRRQIA